MGSGVLAKQKIDPFDSQQPQLDGSILAMRAEMSLSLLQEGLFSESYLQLASCQTQGRGSLKLLV